jgi:hypothetical protein
MLNVLPALPSLARHLRDARAMCFLATVIALFQILCSAPVKCAEDLRARQRIVIVLLDRTGSMATRFRDPETRVELTRLQHSWRYLNRDLREELGKGADGLSIYFLPFSREPLDTRDPFARPAKIAATGPAEIEAQVKNFERRISPEGETDIVWAVDKAVELLESLKIEKLSPEDRANVRLILYSDGNHNALRLPNGAKRAFADEDIARNPKLKQELQNQLEESFRRLYKFFDSKKEVLSGDLDIFHWGNNPVESAIKDLRGEKPANFNVGNNPVDKPTGKIDVIEFVDVRVIKQGDGARISGRVKITSGHIARATMSVKLDAPYDTVPAFTAVMQSPQDGTLESFALDIARANLKRKSKVMLEAKIMEATPAPVATGGIYIGKGTSMPLIIGTDASIALVSPADGIFREVFEDMTTGEPQSALLKLRWNDAAKSESLNISLPRDPALTIRVEPVKPDGSMGPALSPGEHRIAGLFGDTQSGALKFTVTASQKFAGPVTKDLLNLASKDAMPDTLIKAVMKVSPPRVLFEGLSRRVCEYDSDQIDRPLKFPVLFIKPSAGVKEAVAELSVLNFTPEKLKGVELSLSNDTRIDGGRVTVHEPSVVFITLTPASAKALEEYKPEDLKLSCKLLQSKIDSVFGYGFDTQGQLPLAVDFADTPHFKIVKLTGPDGKPVDFSQPFEFHMGQQREFTLHVAWNTPAIEKTVTHPFATPINLGVAQLEAELPVGEWMLDKSRSRQIKLKLTATEVGTSEAQVRELGISGLPSVQLNFPRLRVDPSAFDFKIELRGEGDALISPAVPLTIRAGVPQLLTLRAKWDERAEGKTVVHPLNAPLILDGLAKLEADPYVGAWRLDSTGHREIQVRLTGIADGKIKARSISFSIETAFVALANLPPLNVYVPAFTFKVVQARPLELAPGKSVTVPFVFDDATDPKLPETFWKIGGGGEKLNLKIDSSDPDFSFAFADGNSDTVKLSQLKPGASVPILIAYKGPQGLAKSQAKTLAAKFTLSAPGKSGDSAPPMVVNADKALNVSIAPSIPPWIWDLLLLGAPVAIIVWMIGKKNKALQPAVAAPAFAEPSISGADAGPLSEPPPPPVESPSAEPAPESTAEPEIDHIRDAGERF